MSLIIATAAMLALPAQSEAPQTALWSDPEVFRCGPSVVRPGDTLVLSKQSSALRELAVLRPGASLPLVLVVDAAPAGTPGLMSGGTARTRDRGAAAGRRSAGPRMARG